MGLLKSMTSVGWAECDEAQLSGLETSYVVLGFAALSANLQKLLSLVRLLRAAILMSVNLSIMQRSIYCCLGPAKKS
jgi:hypothetical protein